MRAPDVSLEERRRLGERYGLAVYGCSACLSTVMQNKREVQPNKCPSCGAVFIDVWGQV